MPARYPEAVAGRRRRPTSEDAPLGNKPPMMHTGLFPLACPHPLSACYAGRRRPPFVTLVLFVVAVFMIFALFVVAAFVALVLFVVAAFVTLVLFVVAAFVTFALFVVQPL